MHNDVFIKHCLGVPNKVALKQKMFLLVFQKLMLSYNIRYDSDKLLKCCACRLGKTIQVISFFASIFEVNLIKRAFHNHNASVSECQTGNTNSTNGISKVLMTIFMSPVDQYYN